MKNDKIGSKNINRRGNKGQIYVPHRWWQHSSDALTISGTLVRFGVRVLGLWEIWEVASLAAEVGCGQDDVRWHHPLW